MDFLKNLFVKKQDKTQKTKQVVSEAEMYNQNNAKTHEDLPKVESGQIENAGQNAQYQELLSNEFALEFCGTGWAFKGSVDQNVSLPNNPALCLAVLKELRAKFGFNQICIVVVSSSVLIVCKGKGMPPLAAQTSLDATGTAHLIRSFQENGKEVYKYEGAWLFSLH